MFSCFEAVWSRKKYQTAGDNMKLNIEFSQHARWLVSNWSEIRERDSISILCTDREDGLKYFADHYPAAKIENVEEA
jgi:hypothetical protein